MVKSYPNYFTLRSLLDSVSNCSAHINDKWVPCRPLGFQSLASRFRLAWKVFKGEADCLVWPEGQ